jgi:hypothetical protein
LVLTVSFIFAIKSRGLAEPFDNLEAETGATLDFVAAKIRSRNRYKAARATPKDRIKTSEEEVAIVMVALKAGENVVRLEDVIV